MTHTADQESEATCPAEYTGPFFAYDFMPQKIMFKSHIGDTMALDVLSVRGWGYLTGKGGGLGIDPEVAAKIQDNFGKWVVETLNAALVSSSTPSPWKDIESAPKNGTEILVWRRDASVFIVRWEWAGDVVPKDRSGDPIEDYDEEFHGWWSDAYGWQQGIDTPTHWMPLPPPPTGEA